jgi:3-isopropylmalate/(R)-2-methylmalate dehydratase small subunit
MSQEMVIKGRAWVCGDYVDAYKILPEKHWRGGTQFGEFNLEEMGKHAMEGVDPDFGPAALEGKYSIIVGGRNFGGGGKSIEHPIFAIKGSGVKAVIAESASRYFFRNAVNNGLPILICEGITARVKTGDELEVNLSGGEILNVTSGVKIAFVPVPESLLLILSMGGLIPYTKDKMARRQTEG